MPVRLRVQVDTLHTQYGDEKPISALQLLQRFQNERWSEEEDEADAVLMAGPSIPAGPVPRGSIMSPRCRRRVVGSVPRSLPNPPVRTTMCPMQCHCSSGRDFEACCGPFLAGEATPDSPEALMRSRYSAYATENVDYVLATHDPDTVGEVDREGALAWARDSVWEGLEIVDTAGGGPGDDEGEVEFIARYQSEGHSVAHHERSRFRRIEGRWYYLDGDMVKPKPVVRSMPKVGRNEPCPCGSGKKYMKCHGSA